MNTLQKIGGSILALVLILAVATGLSSPRGTGVLSAVGTFSRGVWGWLGDVFRSLGGSSIAGNVALAFGIGLGLSLLLVVAVPAARASRGGAVAAILAGGLVGVLLYNPAIVAGLAG